MSDQTKNLQTDSAKPAAPEKFEWETYRGALEGRLEMGGYEVFPAPADPVLIRAKKDWGQISASVYIDSYGQMRYTLTRPTDQAWSQPIQSGAYTFEVSRTISETLTVLRSLTNADCKDFGHLLDELEIIGHASWKELNIR